MFPKCQGENITFHCRHTRLSSRQCLVNKGGNREKVAEMWKEVYSMEPRKVSLGVKGSESRKLKTIIRLWTASK